MEWCITVFILMVDIKLLFSVITEEEGNYGNIISIFHEVYEEKGLPIPGLFDRIALANGISCLGFTSVIRGGGSLVDRRI